MYIFIILQYPLSRKSRMKYCFFSLLSLVCLVTQVVAQQRLITCNSVVNADRSISINSESIAYGDYTLKINFQNLQGYRGVGVYNDMGIFVVQRGNRELVRLVMDKSANFYSAGSSYIYYAGSYLNKHPSDTGFLYLLPGTPNNVLRITRVTSLESRLGQTSENAYIGTGFGYASGDTICASRAGLVYECSDEVKEGETGMEVFKRTRNRIFVQQRDGTLAHYEIRAPIKLLVENGDNVIPGQPIAVFNKESERYEMMLSVQYLDGAKLLSIKNSPVTIQPNPYRFLQTIFCIGEDMQKSALQVPNQTFKVAYPKELIGKELSKKEKKKSGLL